MAFIQSFIMFILKIFTWKQGASLIFSFTASIFSTIFFSKLNDRFFKEADLKNVYMPIMIESFMIIAFLGMIMIDFYLGQKVSTRVRKEPFNWDRGVDTIAKVFAMILMTSVVMFLAIASESAGINWLWMGLTASLSVVWFLGIGFEFGSIGRHLESLTGSKPSIFKFFDRILIKIQERAIDKVSGGSLNNFENEKDINDSSSN